MNKHDVMRCNEYTELVGYAKVTHYVSKAISVRQRERRRPCGISGHYEFPDRQAAFLASANNSLVSLSSATSVADSAE